MLHEPKYMKIIKFISILLLVIGIFIFCALIYTSNTDGIKIFSDKRIDFAITGQFGDYVGGVIGTLFTLSGTLLIYLSFNQQNIDRKNESFESTFFELIRIHRENVTELEYKKHNKSDIETYNNRQVFRVLFNEFISCYREIKKYSNSKDISTYLIPTYKRKLESLLSKQQGNIDIYELTMIDIAYTIFFYGVGEEGEYTIKGLFIKKYQQDFYNKLIFYIKLKPKYVQTATEQKTLHYDSWNNLIACPPKDLHAIINDLYKNRKNKNNIKSDNHLTNRLFYCIQYPYIKYYGGHQFRLGHYFRNLFLTCNYLNDSHVNDKDKYKYAKILRAQISTYEQALLFINSISGLGMKWELNPDINNQINTKNLITKYNLIKNLPGVHITGIRYKDYYPNVSYETDEQVL